MVARPIVVLPPVAVERAVMIVIEVALPPFTANRVGHPLDISGVRPARPSAMADVAPAPGPIAAAAMIATIAVPVVGGDEPAALAARLTVAVGVGRPSAAATGIIVVAVVGAIGTAAPLATVSMAGEPLQRAIGLSAAGA